VVAVVGRAARREERLGDPVDLLIVASELAGATRWADRFRGLADGLAERYGVVLRPIGYDLASAKAMWTARTSAAERSVREAELVHGSPLLEVLS
jgi:hypothetical protein